MSLFCGPDGQFFKTAYLGVGLDIEITHNGTYSPPCSECYSGNSDAWIFGGGVNVSVSFQGPNFPDLRQGHRNDNGHHTVAVKFGGSTPIPWKSTEHVYSVPRVGDVFDGVVYNVTISCTGTNDKVDSNGDAAPLSSVFSGQHLTVNADSSCVNSTAGRFLLFDACATYSLRAAATFFEWWGKFINPPPLTRCT